MTDREKKMRKKHTRRIKSKRLWAAASIITAVVLCFSSAGAEIENAGTYLRKNVVTRTLSNGITLIMLNRGYAPTLAFEISFSVGSSDEEYRTIGTAHLLEHMLFKGTDRLGTTDYEKEKVILDEIEAVGETIDRLRLSSPDNTMIPGLEKRLRLLQEKHRAYVVSSPYDRIYTGNGGVGFNASTSRDKTGYYIELPASKLELWARTESERLRNPVLREFYLERNNVLEERLMRYDSSASGRLFEQFLAAAYSAHPYRHPIIGWKSNIPYLSIKDVRKFYRDHYIPSRMTITIVGKQDTEKTYKTIEQYFGKIRSRPDPPRTAIDEPEQPGEKRIIVNFPANPSMIIGWHKPSYPARADYVFDVIQELLAGGRSSRLYRSLVVEKKLASSVSAWNGAPGARYNNMFVVLASPQSPHSAREVEEAVYSEIESMIRQVSGQELQKVINSMESDLIFSLASSSGLASLLSYYQTVFGDWRYAAEYMEAIKSVTPEEIKKEAEKYLTPKNRVVAILKDSRREETK